MDRFFLLIPALIVVAILVVAFAIYSVRCALGRAPQLGEVKHNEIFGLFFARFLVWLISPVERAMIGRVSANAITMTSLVLCLLSGFAIADGRLANGCWIFVVAGILDVLDGRLARHAQSSSPAGALFDSVSDRWGELFVFGGVLWFLHDSPWMLAALAGLGGSMMVSYTRARAEALGVRGATGMMQRAERIFLVTGGLFVAAWFELGDDDRAVTVLGIAMLVTGVTSSATAISRFVAAYRGLAARKPEPLVVLPAPKPPVVPAPSGLPASPAAPARAIRSVGGVSQIR